MKPQGTFRAFAQKVDYNNAVEIYLAVQHEHGDDVAQPFTFERREPDTMSQPAMRLKLREAQTLIDALWEAGLRPSKAEDATAELTAVRHHLADMRHLAFKGKQP